MSSDSEESYDSLPKDPVHFGFIREKWEVASILTPDGVGPLVSNPIKQRRSNCLSRQIMCPTDELMLIPDHVSPSAIDLEFTVNETDIHEKGRTRSTSIGFSYFQALDVKNSKEENINDQELVVDEYLSSSSNDISSEIPTTTSRNVVNEDLDPDLSNATNCNIEERKGTNPILGYESVTDTPQYTPTILSPIFDTTMGNDQNINKGETTAIKTKEKLIVDEVPANTSEKVQKSQVDEMLETSVKNDNMTDKSIGETVVIEKMFDENVDTDSKDITMIENVSTTETIKEEKSNDSFSVTNTDTPSDKDLGHDIEVKELEVREVMTIAASDDFNFETPSEALIVLIQNETNTIMKSTTNEQRIPETGSIKELKDSDFTTESEDATPLINDMIDKEVSKVKSKESEYSQDIHIKVSKSSFNSENEGNVVTDTLTKLNVEESDEIENTLSAKKGVKSDQIVKIEKIFDENVDADSNDATLIEISSTTGMIEEEKSNDSISVTHFYNSGDKYLSQDIDIKQAEEREEITAAVSNELHFSTTESQDATQIPNDMIDKKESKVESKENESLQDVHVKLSKPLFTSENEGNVVLDTFAISKVEESDEIEDNDTLSVNEDIESDKINIKKKIVAEDTKMRNSLGVLPCTKEVIGSIETNDTLYNVSSVQDSDMKLSSLSQSHSKEETGCMASPYFDSVVSDSVKLQTSTQTFTSDKACEAGILDSSKGVDICSSIYTNSESVINTMSEEDIDKISDNNCNLQGSILCQSSNQLHQVDYMDDNLKESNELDGTSLLRETEDKFLNTLVDEIPNFIQPTDVTNPVQSHDHDKKEVVATDSVNGDVDSLNLNQIASEGHITTLENGVIQCLDDNQADENLSEVRSLEQNKMISEETKEAGSLQDVLSNNSEKVQDNEPNKKKDKNLQVTNESQVWKFFQEIDDEESAIENNSANKSQSSPTVSSHISIGKTSPKSTEDQNTEHMKDKSEFLNENSSNISSVTTAENTPNFFSDMPKNASLLPEESDIGENGQAFVRMSIKRKISKAWRQIYYAVFQLTSLYIFRSKEDFEDWKENPYHNQKERDYLVKFQFNFLQEFVQRTNLRGYKQTEIRKKVYHTFKPAMFRFKLECWINTGITSVIFFACLEEEEANKLSDCIKTCLGYCPSEGFRPSSDNSNGLRMI